MKKYMMSLAVIVVAGAAMAFTREEGEAPVERAEVKYIFTGTLLSQANDPDHWDEVPLEAPGCSAGTQLPCSVITDMTIEDWIGNKTDEQVLDQADSQRN